MRWPPYIRKLVVASGVVALLIFAAPIANIAMQKTAQRPSDTQALQEAFVRDMNEKQGDPSGDMLAGVFGDQQGDQQLYDVNPEVAEFINREAFDSASYSDIKAARDSTVIGTLSPRGAAETLDAIVKDATSRGWNQVESGVQGCTSFVRDAGEHRWMLVQCVDVPQGSSVVVWFDRVGGSKG